MMPFSPQRRILLLRTIWWPIAATLNPLSMSDEGTVSLPQFMPVHLASEITQFCIVQLRPAYMPINPFSGPVIPDQFSDDCTRVNPSTVMNFKPLTTGYNTHSRTL